MHASPVPHKCRKVRAKNKCKRCQRKEEDKRSRNNFEDKENKQAPDDSSKPGQRKIKHLPSEPSRSWAQTQYQGTATPEIGAVRGGKMGWLCKLESHCKPSNDGVSIPFPNHEDATSLLYPQQKVRFAPGERSWEDPDSGTRTRVGHGAMG